MKIFVASDHAGFELKTKIAEVLRELGHDIANCGDFAPDQGDDYPDFIVPLARKVAEEKGNFGIVFGGSGEGEAMAANRVPGARAVVWYGGNRDILTVSRQHNDSNILSIGARFVSAEEAEEAVKLWLATPFSGDERHVRRLAKF